MRVRTADGEPAMLVIAVPKGDGAVWASLGKTAVKLDPTDVSKLVELYRAAQTVAMEDRGRW